MPPRISLVHQFEQQQAETWYISFSPDGKRLVSSDGQALYLWRLDEGGSWDYEQSLPFRAATFPRFTPDSKRLAFRDKDDFVQLLSVDQGEKEATLSSPASTDFTFSPDQRWLVTGDTKRNLLLWDLLTYQSLLIPVRFPRVGDDPGEQEPTRTNETLRSFRLTPDGQRLVLLADSEDGYLHLCYFDPTDESLMRQKTFSHRNNIDLAISPDGKMLATIVTNQRGRAYKDDIYVYDLESRQRVHVFPQAADDVYRYCLLAFSPDSHSLLSCKSDGWIDIFSLYSFECLAHFAAHPGLSSHASEPIGGIDWSKTGYIVTGGASIFEKDMKKTDYTIKIWRVEEE